MFRVNLGEYELVVDAETAENIRKDEEFAETYLNMLRMQYPEPGEGFDSRDMEEDSQQDGDRQTTVDVEADSDGSTRSKKRKQGFTWRHKMLMLFFDIYKNRIENFKNINHKVAWQKVATEITNQGYDLSWQQCQIKMDTLKRRYKNIKDFENSTGSLPITWEYYPIKDDLFGNRKWAKPLAGALSSTTPVKNSTPKIDNPKRGNLKMESKETEYLNNSIGVQKAVHQEKK